MTDEMYLQGAECRHKWPRAASQQELQRFLRDASDQLPQTAYPVAGDPAETEHLVQETSLQAARHWHKIRTTDHPAAYARRMRLPCE